ncbi:hypothetical protein ACFL21_03720 [Patescibacteria group bacterium]
MANIDDFSGDIESSEEQNSCTILSALRENKSFRVANTIAAVKIFVLSLLPAVGCDKETSQENLPSLEAAIDISEAAVNDKLSRYDREPYSIANGDPCDEYRTVDPEKDELHEVFGCCYAQDPKGGDVPILIPCKSAFPLRD